jgi:ATP-dependent RNA helicase DDX51/DBP6
MQLLGLQTVFSLQGGSSKVDILICTPGRLMDHIHGTPNFTLQHLRFLVRRPHARSQDVSQSEQVIDEADRLLARSFQDWLAQVLAATRPPTASPIPGPSQPLGLPYPDALAPAFLHLSYDASGIETDLDDKKESSCQKLLFSATLMSDPGRIHALELRNPHYIVVQQPSAPDRDTDGGVLDVVMEKFSVPTSLKVRAPSLPLLCLPTGANLCPAGTHDHLRAVAQAIATLLPRPLAWRAPRARLHEEHRVDCAPR